MRWLTALLLVLAAACVQAQDVQPVPPLSARVIDQTGTLDAAQRQTLEDRLAAYEPSAGGATSSSANTGSTSSQATAGSRCECP